jgi:hypothetical protein
MDLLLEDPVPHETLIFGWKNMHNSLATHDNITRIIEQLRSQIHAKYVELKKN